MTARLCPVCDVPSRLLPYSTYTATVTYYRCERCGLVCTYDKALRTESPQTVAVRATGGGK